MHQIASRFTKYLIVKGIVNEDIMDEHIYGIEIMLGKMINHGTIILMACIDNNLIPTLFFMVSFLLLRGRTGGFHCRNAFHCYCGTILIYIFVSKIFTRIILVYRFLVPSIIVISGIIIFTIAPINHPNLELNDEEIRLSRRLSRKLSLIISISALTVFQLRIIPIYTSYIVAGLGTDAGLLIIAKILKQEVKN